MSDKLLKIEKRMDRAEAADKIRDIADKIDEGELKLTSGDNSVELKPSKVVDFEVEVEEEADGDRSIEIEVEWSEGDVEEDIEIG